MNIILFGPPGAGKGTQSQKIAKKFNLHQVSTGDLLRNEIKNKSDIGNKIEQIISQGNFVLAGFSILMLILGAFVSFEGFNILANSTTL